MTLKRTRIFTFQSQNQYVFAFKVYVPPEIRAEDLIKMFVIFLVGR